MAKYRALRNNIFNGRLVEAGTIIETELKVTEHFECIDAPKPDKTKKGKAPAEQPGETPVDPPVEDQQPAE